jgi:hypothetical protein
MLTVRKEIIDKLCSGAGVDTVKDALKAAVLTELMTIPPYLTAMFSLPADGNDAVKLVHSVVFEEMLHLTLAANTLIAIGGDVPIFDLGTRVRYPSTFPLDVDDGLMVGLTSLTKQQTRDVFMAIERPDTQAELPGETAPPALPIGPHSGFASLGDFYDAVIRALADLGSKAFANPRTDKQVDISQWFPYEIDGCPQGRVSSFATAQAALNKIIEQGEGKSITEDPINPKDGDYSDEGRHANYAHYFKFGEIYYGRTLVPDSTDRTGWSYSGDPVRLKQENICRVQENAALSDYPLGSGAYIAGTEFYETYCSLLRALDETFNGNPERLNSALGLMFQLKLVAQQVMQFPVGDGLHAAPPFMPDHVRGGRLVNL